MGGEEQAKPESLSDSGYTAFEKWDYRPFVHSVGCSTAPFDGNSGCRSTSGLTTIRSIGSTKASNFYMDRLRALAMVGPRRKKTGDLADPISRSRWRVYSPEKLTGRELLTKAKNPETARYVKRLPLWNCAPGKKKPLVIISVPGSTKKIHPPGVSLVNGLRIDRGKRNAHFRRPRVPLGIDLGRVFEAGIPRCVAKRIVLFLDF